MGLGDDGEFGPDLELVVLRRRVHIEHDQRDLRACEKHSGQWSNTGPCGRTHETTLSGRFVVRYWSSGLPDLAVLNRLGNGAEIVEFNVDKRVGWCVVGHVGG